MGFPVDKRSKIKLTFETRYVDFRFRELPIYEYNMIYLDNFLNHDARR